MSNQIVTNSCSNAAGFDEEADEDGDGINDPVELSINLMGRIIGSVNPGVRVLGYKVPSKIRTLRIDENLVINIELRDGGSSNVFVGYGTGP